MLREIDRVMQFEGEPRRRWFSDAYSDLVVWLSDDDLPQGFELSYDKGRNERLVSWRAGAMRHLGVDDGEGRAMHQKATPLVVADGELKPISVLARFLVDAVAIDQDIARWVVGHLLEQGTGDAVVPQALRQAELDSLNRLYDDEEWVLEPHGLRRRFRFRDFTEAFAFMSAVAPMAELLDHHPDWSNSYREVDVYLTTHSKKELSWLDIILAQAMNSVAA